MRDNADLVLLPDGIGHSPRVKEPESAMLPGMAAPAAREPDKRLFRGRPILRPDRRETLPPAIVEAIERGESTGYEWLALLASMPDTSLNNPSPAAPPPLQWNYDYSPTTGAGRAIMPGNAQVVGGFAVLGSSQASFGGGITGVTDGSSAVGGTVGEYLTAATGAVGLTTGTAANAGSISLTAGDWDVWGTQGFTITVAASALQAGLTTTSATLPSPAAAIVHTAADLASGSQLTLFAVRFSLAATTTIFLVAQANFASGTVTTASGSIFARRRR